MLQKPQDCNVCIATLFTGSKIKTIWGKISFSANKKPPPSSPHSPFNRNLYSSQSRLVNVSSTGGILTSTESVDCNGATIQGCVVRVLSSTARTVAVVQALPIVYRFDNINNFGGEKRRFHSYNNVVFCEIYITILLLL